MCSMCILVIYNVFNQRLNFSFLYAIFRSEQRNQGTMHEREQVKILKFVYWTQQSILWHFFHLGILFLAWKSGQTFFIHVHLTLLQRNLVYSWKKCRISLLEDANIICSYLCIVPFGSILNKESICFLKIFVNFHYFHTHTFYLNWIIEDSN